VGGEVNPHGMVVDFADVKNSVRRLILDRLDHTLLNNEIDNPTAERVAHYIFDQLTGANLAVTRIRLWETPTCYVDVEP
jgi:6-pyruvoyltetrahydropterin/6-carboxytetrahydropterin synthase